MLTSDFSCIYEYTDANKNDNNNTYAYIYIYTDRYLLLYRITACDTFGCHIDTIINI